MSSERTKITLEHVAAHAGVSIVTVSRVVRNPARVAAKTRAKVRAAIDELGYLPDFAASALASRRSGMVAIAVPTLATSIFGDTVQGIIEGLKPFGLRALIADTGYLESEIASIVRTLLRWSPEGIVLTGDDQGREIADALRATRIPVVQTWELPADPVDSVVGVSNHAAGSAVADHFLSRGYRHIAFVGPGRDDRRAWQRRAGLLDRLQEKGIALLHSELTPRAPRMAAGAAAVRRILAVKPQVEAIFFANDGSAAGAICECARMGVAVPGRLAIAGFGDIEIAAEINPRLTTIAVPRRDIGWEAARLLAGRIGGTVERGTVMDIGFRLEVRESS